MNIFLTGNDGYIGSLLAPILAKAGHDVVGCDTGYYRDGWLYTNPLISANTPPVLNKDIRLLTAEDLAGVDTVVHLAELSNDPLGENRPTVTYDINHVGSVNLAQIAKEAGVKRFVYTSSCSVYGVSDENFVDEESPVDPQTAYAKCKVLVEKDISALGDRSFCPTFLRNSTAYGASPRMRFDIVLNNLAGLAWTTNRIAMTSDGTPWRPLVHVLDICEAISSVIDAPVEKIFNEIFNVGPMDSNYTVREIAEIVGEHFPKSKITFGPAGGDNRSYRVRFDKIHRHLPNFSPKWTADAGAAQLKKVFSRIEMNSGTFDFRAYTRLKQLNYLIRTSQLDDEFYWSTDF